MKNIIFLVGLPGSGKSTFYETSLKEKLTPHVYIDQSPYSLEDLQIMIENHDTVVFECPTFCVDEHLSRAKLFFKGWNQTYFFWENNSEQCLKNAKFRPNKYVDSYIKLLSKIYKPKGLVFKVYEQN